MAVIRLELESSFASGVGERLHTAMIFVVATIELSGCDARFNSSLGHEFTNQCGRVTVTTQLYFVANTLVASAGANKGLALLVIDDLTSEVFE